MTKNIKDNKLSDVTEAGQFLAHVSDVIFHVAQKNIDTEQARAIAKEVSARISVDFAGQYVYISKAGKTIVKQLSIYRDMKDGQNPKDVALKHDVSVAWVYEVYKKMRKNRIKQLNQRAQSELPFDKN